MNKSFHNVALRIILVVLAICVRSAQACSSCYNTFEGHYAGVVEFCPACLQSVDGNMSDLYSYGPNGYRGDGIHEDTRHESKMASEEWDGEEPDSPVYEVRPSEGKGLGVFAKKLIPRGTHIIIEEPLLSVAMPEMVTGQGFRIKDMLSDLETKFQALLLEQQEEFLQLHDFRFPTEESQSHLLTIFRSNAYNTGDKNIGLFPKIARINHSCKPNSGNWWSEKLGHRVIYAAVNIPEGDEITVSYIPLLKKTSERQKRLSQYGFTCNCSACQPASAEGDKKRIKIASLLETLEQRLHYPSDNDAVDEKYTAKALSLVELVEEEGLVEYLSKSFELAAIFNKRIGKLEAAEIWARKELEILKLAEESSAEVQQVEEFIESLE